MLRGILGAVVGLLVMLAAGYAAAVVYINTDGQRLAELYFQPWGRRGEVTYGSVHKPLFADAVTIRDIAVRTPDGRTFRIERIVIRDYDWLNLRQPRHADVTIERAETTPDGLGPDLAPTVKASGLDKLIASAHYRYRYNDDNNRFVIETVRVDIAEIGTLTLTARLDLDRYPDLSEMKSPARALQTAASAKLIGARVKFRNTALVQHILRSYAASNGIEVEPARKRLMEELAEMRRRAKDPIQKDALRAAGAFVEKPGEIEAVAAPSAPVSLQSAAFLMVASPGELKRMLGLRIEARPPEGPTPTAPPEKKPISEP